MTIKLLGVCLFFYICFFCHVICKYTVYNKNVILNLWLFHRSVADEC